MVCRNRTRHSGTAVPCSHKEPAAGRREALGVLTANQVEAVAPDANSAKAGKLLADVRKWQALGHNEERVWGLCQGSGRAPYQTQAICAEPLAFRCTCPSKKFPCKHALGLLFLHATGQVPAGEPPPWVRDWSEKRTVARQPKAEKPPDPEAQARRAAQRASRVEEGVAFLNQWLEDLVREGISAAQTWPDRFWWDAAARLVDTQAAGLARMVRRVPEILGSPDWQIRLAEHLGRMHLLLQAYRRIDELSPDLQAEVRTRLGWTQSQQELAARPGLQAQWCVVGQRVFEDENLRTLRTWLWNGERFALLLDFSVGMQPLANPWVPGSWMQAELVPYAGVEAQRMLLKGVAVPTLETAPPRALASLQRFLEDYARSLAENPWQETVPALLSLRPAERAGWLVDREGNGLRFWPDARHARLAALSGGLPIPVFGEWDGHGYRPLAAWSEGRCWPLEGEWMN